MLTSLGGSLTGNLGQWILGQTSIQNGIGDLITVKKPVSTQKNKVSGLGRKFIRDLVWMSLSDGLGGEKEGTLEGVWVDVDAHPDDLCMISEK